MYAIIAADGRQYKVQSGDEIQIDLRDGDRSLFHATPVAADGRLFIRSDKFLYCLEKK